MKKQVKRALITVVALCAAAGFAVLLMARQVSGLAGTADSVNPVMASAAALVAVLAGVFVFAVRSWRAERNSEHILLNGK